MRGLRTGVAIALTGLLAGGSGAWAASQITSSQIKDGTIQAKDIKKGSLGADRLSAAAQRTLQGKQGPAGSAGPAGPAGPVGEAGQSTALNVMKSATTANCPAGSVLVSALCGGASNTNVLTVSGNGASCSGGAEVTIACQAQ